jgi:hypothetical protein
MKISVHAAQRFLERVMSKVDYNHVDVNFAIKYLEKVLQDVIPRASTSYFVLPRFENFRVIYKENVAITIIPKGDKNVR